MAKLYREKKKEDSSLTAGEILSFLLNIPITLYMFAVFIILPFYNQEGYKHIGTDKSVFFRYWGSRFGIAAAVFAIPLVICRVREKKGKLLLYDYFAVFWGISLLLSYCCSRYKETAWLGAGGWYMGLLAQLIMAGFFLVISAEWKVLRAVPMLTIPVSAVVFLLGILNKFGVYPIDMQVKEPSFISTIGNVNWYCGYLIVILFFGIGYFIFEEKQKLLGRILLMLYIALGVAALETQGSDSGILAMAAVFVILFPMAAKENSRLLRFSAVLLITSLIGLLLFLIRRKGLWSLQLGVTDRGAEILTNTSFSVFFFLIAVILLAVAVYLYKKKKSTRIMGMLAVGTAILSGAALLGFVIFLAVNTMQQGALSEMLGWKDTAAFVYNENWGSNRGATWEAGARVFAEQDFLHKLTGVGPDCMSAYIYTDGSVDLKELVNRVFEGLKLTNAHNEWLTILADEGLFGLIGFAGLICASVILFLKEGSKNPLAGACGLSVLAYTCNLMFSFQQSMCTPTMFLFLGIGAAAVREKRQKEKDF